MVENLVIVESPAKAKTIEKFLGKDYVVKSSFGHIRDLKKRDLSIDLENNYQPHYTVPTDKKKIVTELKKMAADAKTVWLASDEDREGEAIAWHLAEALNLDHAKTKRIVFHEITKDAILNAIKTPRKIDQHLVNAQQARRVLDRIVGFEISPILWRKVKPALSAGRVQSVAVKLIVEREREVEAFEPQSSFRVIAEFLVPNENGDNTLLKAELSKRFKTAEETATFLQGCAGADFVIDDISKKPTKKSPAPPFTTSTLQQEASRKLGYSVSQTMSIAQRLYESGHITYMRTDSVNLSSLAINTSKSEIIEQFGAEYSKVRKYSTQSKGAQEAHEAIRPTYVNQHEISGSAQEQRLYELIWKRTVASQMSDAQLEKTTIKIGVSGHDEYFNATGEVIKFDGFLKLYIESSDDEDNGSEENGLLPAVKLNQQLDLNQIVATERFTQKPPRYTEASLVRKLEELGIGRPSTYAPTISTIQNREYVVKESREGDTREYAELVLKNGAVKETTKKENYGYEKSKLFPTDIGMVVNDFLDENFTNIMNYNFTAEVEKEFDVIAEGKLDWTKAIDEFYKDFHPTVEKSKERSDTKVGERILGTDPKSGRQVSVKIGRFGPMVQIGTAEEEEKPQFASLLKGQSINSINLEEALELFKLPREVGEYEGGKVVIGVGRFGPYVRHASKFVSLGKEDDPLSITLGRSIELIEAKREQEKNSLIKTFDEEPDLQILKGRFGPYIKYKKKNFKIPKGTDPEALTLEKCMELTKDSGSKGKKTAGKNSKKTATKKSAKTSKK
ncbi:type I DNA topoisomerase [Saccharicrinis sp. FJH54]|uniref:type I DNA topoisomerase n=1 Tax=Saccharicrinis sp. FJH54 TaxID=3344665 RepID=UPI0035D4DCF1